MTSAGVDDSATCLHLGKEGVSWPLFLSGGGRNFKKKMLLNVLMLNMLIAVRDLYFVLGVITHF